MTMKDAILSECLARKANNGQNALGTIGREPEVENRVTKGSPTALDEIVAECAKIDRWGTLSFMDISLRYRRTVIGPLWLTLTLGSSIASVGTVYAVLFKQDVSIFLPSFAMGLIVWTLISSTLQEGSSIFVASTHLIKAVPAPLIVHVLQLMARNIIVFAHHFVLIFFVYFVFPWPITWHVVLVVPGLIILFVTLFGAVTSLAILCARYRDIGTAIISALQFVFFLTPIMWTADALKGTSFEWLTHANPFATLLQLVRGPVLCQPVDSIQWMLGASYAALMLFVSLHFYARYRHRIAYWL